MTRAAIAGCAPRLLVATLLCAGACAAEAPRGPSATGPPPASAPASPTVRVRVIGINDLHGQIVAGRKLGTRDVGSAAVLASCVRASVAAHPGPSFIALAGDCVGASPAASALLQDEPTVAFLNQLANEACAQDESGPRAAQCNVVAALGNHEFDEGWRELLRLWQGGRHANGPFLQREWTGARFPVICSNVVHDSGKPLVRSEVVRDADGVRIAFIGAVVKSTPNLVMPSMVDGLRFLDEADAINARVKALQSGGVHAFVVVLHEGGRQAPYPGDTRDVADGDVTGRIREVCRRLDADVDVVVSGHAHQFTNARLPRDAGGPVLVTQAWSSGSAFAEIDLVLDRATRDVTSSVARIVTAWADSGPGRTPDAAALALTRDAERSVAPLVERVVATLAAPITRRDNDAGESALGDLVADAQRAAVAADLAFMNPGGLRADLPAGPVTWGRLFESQPFGNVVMSMELTGAQIRSVLERQISRDEPMILPVSGLRWVRDGRRVASATVNGAPLDDAKTYRVAVNSYLASGGDGFAVFTKGGRPTAGPTDLEALVAYLKSLPQPVRITPDGRIAQVPDTARRSRPPVRER